LINDSRLGKSQVVVLWFQSLAVLSLMLDPLLTLLSANVRLHYHAAGSA